VEVQATLLKLFAWVLYVNGLTMKSPNFKFFKESVKASKAFGNRLKDIKP